ncbi:MAG: PQQ-dependent sugar dehydrogenase [Gammaproteobacteria bacterium]
MAGSVFLAGVTTGLFLPQPAIAKRAVREVRDLRKQLSVNDAQDSRNFKFRAIETALHSLEMAQIPVGTFAGGGGALARTGTTVLFTDALGNLGYLRPEANGTDYEIRHLAATVPMNRAGLLKSEFAKDPEFNISYFRTLELLAVPRSDGQFDLYVSHHRYADNCIQFVVSRVVLAETPTGLQLDASSWDDVFVAKPCIPKKATGHPFAGHESGGRLALIGSNSLLVTLGDYEFDGVNGPYKASMDPATDLGKTIEINLDTRQRTIYTSGQRNPQGLYIAPDGVVWETEHGPHGGDELNILKRGQNYGWPEVSYGLNYGFPSRPWRANTHQGRHDGYTKPVFAFMPSIGISNLLESTGEEFPLWRGDLLVTALKDRSIWRLRYEDNRVIYSERIPVGERVRDLEQLPSGQLMLLTDDANILLIRRKDDAEPGAPRVAQRSVAVSGYRAFNQALAQKPSTNEGPEANLAFGRSVFESRCAGCHTGTPGTTNGPPLHGVVGRRIGSVDGFPYSDALAGAEGIWTRQRLLDFLSDASHNFQGTTMPEVVLPYRVYEPVVDYLEQTG